MAETEKLVKKEFQDLLSGLDVILSEKGILLYDKEVKPIDLETFLYNKEYLGLDIRLSPKQLDALEKLDDDSPSNPYVEGVFELGKGSGKDLLATLFFARRAYKLLCMGNPQKKFGMAGSETIDLLNVALSGDQAKKVFFVRFSNIIKNAGKKAFEQFGFDPSKDILKNQINFPKQVIAHSGHSEEQSQEGLNLYAAVMDEVSGFLPDKAQKLYDVISSSIHTRFPKVGKLLLLSYPRYADDFIEVKYKEGLKDPQTFTAIGPTWEWNPKITRESLERDFQKNPEKAQAYYGCKPLESGIGFIRDLEKLEKIKDPNLRNPIDTLGRYEAWFKPSPYTRNTYFCHIDLALGKIDEAGFQTSDVAALAMGHKEESGIIIIDMMKRYTAPATGKEVEFATIRQDIMDLKQRGFNIKKITIDGWQSKDSMQILQRQGFEVELLAIDKGMAHWDTLKEVVVTERIKTYGHFPGEIWGTQVDNVLIHELRHLVLVDGKKVDHLDISSKDISDCVCGVVSNAIAFEEAGFSFAKL